MYFVIRGATRTYYIKNGQDVTDYFAMEYQFAGVVPALFTREASHKAIEVLEDSTVQAIPCHEIERLSNQYIDVCNVGRKMGIIGFLEVQQRMEDMRFLSAAQ